jgi:acyl-CoA thioester hydrolase
MSEEFHFRHELRVRFPETDAQSVVYHANFLVYCDVARVEWFRGLSGGVNRDVWRRESNFDIVLVNATCDYRASAHFDDALTVWIRLAHVGTSSFSFAYRIKRGDAVICDAKTVHVTIDRQARTTRPIPDEFKRQLLAFEESLHRR